MRSRALTRAVGISVIGAATSQSFGDVVFDFESIEGNRNNRAGDYRVLDLEANGVRAVIFRSEGERFTVWNSSGEGVPGSWGSKHLSPVFNYVADDYLVMSFSEPMREVSIEFGDYGEDHDIAEIYVYEEINAQGTPFAHVTGEMGDNDMRWDGPTTLTFVAEPGESFTSIKFRGGEDPFLQSTFIDNIVTRLAVPTPGTLAVLGLGCAAGAGHLRRRDGRG
ncbi:MAG: hypothetical protein ACF8LK_05840 [Phycisphaerales bacterium JB041]